MAFSSFVEDFLQTSSSCFLAKSRVLLESLLFSPCPYKESVSFTSLLQMLSAAGLGSPCPLPVSSTPCLGRAKSRHTLYSPNTIGTHKMQLLWAVISTEAFLSSPCKDLEKRRYLIVLWQLILAIHKIALNLLYGLITEEPIERAQWFLILLSAHHSTNTTGDLCF